MAKANYKNDQIFGSTLYVPFLNFVFKTKIGPARNDTTDANMLL
jgi:hypothetical protein